MYPVQSSSLLFRAVSALSSLFPSPTFTFTFTQFYLSSLLSLAPPLSYLIEIGSLAKFKSKTSSVIILGKEPDATSREKCNGLAASEQLRTLLSKIMMRRTQGEILKCLLPPRTDYIGINRYRVIMYSSRLLTFYLCITHVSLKL